MGFYARYVLPRMLDFTMRQKVLRPFRERIAGAAEGRVLEIGLGGLNLPLYGGNVRSVIGLEPSPELLRLARRYAAAVPIELVKGSAEATFFRSHARAGNRQFCWVFWTWPKRKNSRRRSAFALYRSEYFRLAKSKKPSKTADYSRARIRPEKFRNGPSRAARDMATEVGRAAALVPNEKAAKFPWQLQLLSGAACAIMVAAVFSYHY
jgi:hypothetical protein